MQETSVRDGVAATEGEAKPACKTLPPGWPRAQGW